MTTTQWFLTLQGAIGVSLGTAFFTAVAPRSALGDAFAEGMHAVFLFAGDAAIVGVLNTSFVGSRRAATGG